MLSRDRKTQDAVVRNLEVFGEAAGRLPESVRATAPEIEWRKIVGLRNILAHEYFSVSLPVAWDVVQNKLEYRHIAWSDSGIWASEKHRKKGQAETCSITRALNKEKHHGMDKKDL